MSVPLCDLEQLQRIFTKPSLFNGPLETFKCCEGHQNRNACGACHADGLKELLSMGSRNLEFQHPCDLEGAIPGGFWEWELQEPEMSHVGTNWPLKFGRVSSGSVGSQGHTDSGPVWRRQTDPFGNWVQRNSRESLHLSVLSRRAAISLSTHPPLPAFVGWAAFFLMFFPFPRRPAAGSGQDPGCGIPACIPFRT